MELRKRILPKLSTSDRNHVEEVLVELKDFYKGHYGVEHGQVYNGTYLAAKKKRRQKWARILAKEARRRGVPYLSRDMIFEYLQRRREKEVSHICREL